MDSISPLAKILAEANGIDWRSIQGSGVGGSIVEQDILNYLSRVMSGDEDPPATPVDETPAGWTGEMPPMPAAVAASGLQALSAAGVESDITDFVAQQAQTGQVPGVQAVQTQAAAEPQDTRPFPEVPTTAVYRPAESAPPAAFMAEVPAASPVSPAAPPSAAAVPVQPAETASAQPIGLETGGGGLETAGGPEAPAQPEPVPFTPVPSASEFELGPDGDAESDLEFELDDDLPDDDFQVNEVPMGSLSAPLQPAPVVEPVATPQPMAEQEAPEALARQDVPAVERPAYDPVAPDSEAEFLLADAHPVAETSPAVADAETVTALPMSRSSAPVDPATTSDALPAAEAARVEAAPVPPVQPPVPEGTVGTSGFGLGGFLSRLYGSAATPAPATPPVAAAQPVAPEVPTAAPDPAPVPDPTPVADPAPMQAAATDAPLPAETASEMVIGTAHPEPYMPSFDPAPEASPDAGVPAEDPSGSPLLGEPLISQAPPIPDTPVAGPLVADQWRDQPVEGEEEDAAHAAPETPADVSEPGTAAVQHDPFMLGVPATDQELVSVESEQAAPGVSLAELGQPIALPEAHEGGLEHDLSSAEPDVLQAAPADPDPAPSGPVEADPVQPESMQSEAVQPEPVPSEGAAQDWTALVEPQAEPTEAPTDTVPGLPLPEDSRPESIQPADVQPLGSSSPGAQAITLRLNVDLGVLETARAQLSEALYREVPLSLLVARAASRSLVSLGLSTPGGVALADHAGQPLAADLSADFRASLDGLGQPAQSPPALLVLDAAELGLDELHRGECSLSVGRSGGGPNALSLRGNLDPVRGAKFLHEVASLLGTPILLLF